MKFCYMKTFSEEHGRIADAALFDTFKEAASYAEKAWQRDLDHIAYQKSTGSLKKVQTESQKLNDGCYVIITHDYCDGPDYPLSYAAMYRVVKVEEFDKE